MFGSKYLQSGRQAPAAQCKGFWIAEPFLDLQWNIKSVFYLLYMDIVLEKWIEQLKKIAGEQNSTNLLIILVALIRPWVSFCMEWAVQWINPCTIKGVFAWNIIFVIHGNTCIEILLYCKVLILHNFTLSSLSLSLYHVLETESTC